MMQKLNLEKVPSRYTERRGEKTILNCGSRTSVNTTVSSRSSTSQFLLKKLYSSSPDATSSPNPSFRLIRPAQAATAKFLRTLMEFNKKS